MFQINAPFGGGGRLIEGGVYFLNFEKGGGVYSRGAFKRRGAFNRSNTVIMMFTLEEENFPGGSFAY